MTEIDTSKPKYDFSSDLQPKIAISLIDVKPGRARKDFNHIIRIKESIEQFGQLQPIVLNGPLSNGRYELVAGETRFKCLAMIPEAKGMISYVLKSGLSPLRQKEIELEENAARENLKPYEHIELMAQIDDLKRELYGTQHRGNPDGWSVQKTAQLMGLADASSASKQITLAKKIRARPELKAVVENLPVSAAIRRVEQLEESERTQRLHDAGEIKLTSELFHFDALSFLRTQPSDSIHLHLTDPPFGMSEIEDRKDSVAGQSQSYMAQAKPNDNSTKSEVLNMLTGVVPELFRTLVPGGHCYMFFELELLGEIKSIFLAAGFTIQYPVIIWDKCRTTVPFRGYNYSSCYEAVLYATKPPEPRRMSESCSSIIKEPAIHASQKIHIFEKPLPLLAGFIRRTTNIGDCVCDCFAGSGSTLVAAKQLGRKALGCELDQENFFKAQGRLLQEAVAGMKK